MKKRSALIGLLAAILAFAFMSGCSAESEAVAQVEVESVEERSVFTTIEEEGDALLAVAKENIESDLFAEALASLNGIDTEYSGYAEVENAYVLCRDSVLEYVSAPSSLEEFEAYIKLLEECGELYPTQEFVDRKEKLADELVVFIEVTEIIQTATKLYDGGQFEEAFVTLALGLNEYPENERLATCLVDYHDHYIISVTREALALCEKEEYKDALALVEAAIEEYDCEEFRMLAESIKEQKSVLYRFKNDVERKLSVFADGWTKEEFDVKQTAAEAGAYIVKSGEKLFLGDYSEEEVTVLSFSGNVLAALANVDVLFDLRDLSYDVVHWKDEDYFAVRLATDMIALLPVVGVVKYLDHFQTVAEGAKSAELVKSVGDIGKSGKNAADVSAAVKDVSKTGDDIINAVENAKGSVRTSDAAKDVVSGINKDYELVSTINSRYLGSEHPETGVEYGLRKLEYSDGNKIQGVFPVFDSAANIQLPDDLYKAFFEEQKEYCLEQLQKKTRPIIGGARKNFTEGQLEMIADGKLPGGFTWHHNEEEGLMQLVDAEIHEATRHTGGMSLWGVGYL